jgi:hypothetical protein
MAESTYDRYATFLINGKQTVVPGIKLTSKGTDKRYIYMANVSRLDKISQEFYNSPLFGWLILQANQQFGGLEINIPNNALLTIPFPLIPSLQDYKSLLDNHFYYYGR